MSPVFLRVLRSTARDLLSPKRTDSKQAMDLLVAILANAETRRPRSAGVSNHRTDPSQDSLSQNWWGSAIDLFGNAVELEPSERDAFLKATCDDSLLYRTVKSLVKHHEEDVPTSSPLNVDEDSFVRSISREYVSCWPLDSGGEGVVFGAVERKSGRVVAIKVIREMGTEEGQAALKRLREQHRTLASLDHPTLVKAEGECFTKGEHHYYVMEYVEGRGIEGYAREKHLSFDDLIRLGQQLCQGLQIAHENHVVHGDLSLSNILVNRGGEVRVIDFSNPIPHEDSEKNRLPLTLGFASPEQIKGHRATVQSDVYALGAVLYKLITGHYPCDLHADSARKATRRIRRRHPRRPSSFVGDDQDRAGTAAAESLVARFLRLMGSRPRKLAALDRLLRRALSVNPSRRHQSMAEVDKELARVLSADQPHAFVLSARGLFEDVTSAAARMTRQQATAAFVVLATLGAGVSLMRLTREPVRVS